MVHFCPVGSASSDKHRKSVSTCSLGNFVWYRLKSVTIPTVETSAEILVSNATSLLVNTAKFSPILGTKYSIKTLTQKSTQSKVFLNLKTVSWTS